MDTYVRYRTLYRRPRSDHYYNKPASASGLLGALLYVDIVCSGWVLWMGVPGSVDLFIVHVVVVLML